MKILSERQLMRLDIDDLNKYCEDLLLWYFNYWNMVNVVSSYVKEKEEEHNIYKIEIKD